MDYKDSRQMFREGLSKAADKAYEQAKIKKMLFEERKNLKTVDSKIEYKLQGRNPVFNGADVKRLKKFYNI